MNRMGKRSTAAAVMLAAALAGCALHGKNETPAEAGAAAPTPQPAAPPGQPAAPTREFRLGAASTALVAQAHRQAGAGDYGQAAATLERALRIEPDNPILWTELGRVRLGENNFAQADALGRKSLALATGDPAAQAAAWRLIADSLRGRNRNPEAADAERHAQALAPR